METLNATVDSGLLCRKRLKNLMLSQWCVVLSTQLLASLCRFLCPLCTQTETPGTLSYLAPHPHLKALGSRAWIPTGLRGGHPRGHWKRSLFVSAVKIKECVNMNLLHLNKLFFVVVVVCLFQGERSRFTPQKAWVMTLSAAQTWMLIIFSQDLLLLSWKRTLMDYLPWRTSQVLPFQTMFQSSQISATTIFLIYLRNHCRSLKTQYRMRWKAVTLWIPLQREGTFHLGLTR